MSRKGLRWETLAESRTGGAETRPYPALSVRLLAQPDWIPAFAGMTEGYARVQSSGSGDGRAPPHPGPLRWEREPDIRARFALAGGGLLSFGADLGGERGQVAVIGEALFQVPHALRRGGLEHYFAVGAFHLVP